MVGAIDRKTWLLKIYAKKQLETKNKRQKGHQKTKETNVTSQSRRANQFVRPVVLSKISQYVCFSLIVVTTSASQSPGSVRLQY